MEFSVIIPLYNRGRFIAETLDSVLDQSFPPAEIIVVDDGSTDDGPEIVGRYGNRVTLLRMPQNSGQQAARNAGITRARAGWIAFCDSDDLWTPDHLRLHRDLLEAHPEITFSFSDFTILRDSCVEEITKFDRAPPGYWDRAGRRVVPEGWLLDRSLASQIFLWQPIFPSATVVAKRLNNDIGGFNVAMHGLGPEDMEYTLRCLYRARIGVVPEPGALIRKHGSNYSGDHLRLLLDEITLLKWVKDNHPEARIYRSIIEAEVRRRRIVAVHGAFAARRHDIARRLLAEVAWHDHSFNMCLKRALVDLPDPVGLPLNAALQEMSKRVRRRPTRATPGREPDQAFVTPSRRAGRRIN